MRIEGLGSLKTTFSALELMEHLINL